MSTGSVHTTPRGEATPMEVRELLTYADIVPLTRDRRTGQPLAEQTLRKLQRDARARTVRLLTDMPRPVGRKPNPASRNLPDQPVFDGTEIRTWLADTDRLAGQT